MKVAVFFAKGFEEIEALAVVDVLRRGKVDVVMVGVEEKRVESARGIQIEMDQLLSEVNIQEIGMLVLPGGKGVEKLEESVRLKEIIRTFEKENKYITAICAAPSLLGKLGILQGHKATCYPGFEKYLEGATYTGERVVESGKVITGIGVGAALHFGLKLLEVLKGKEESEKIRKAMLIER